MLIVQSQSTDVYRNLAVEEWLLDHAPQFPILFLYVNDPCVVIGKNQNPWRECRLSCMEKDGVALARRISGGGAVYHDDGNLNVSVMVSRTEYVEQKQYDFIFRSLESLGVHAEKSGRNSLVVDRLKVSGQAFCHRRGHSLHHGTLLVNADLARLGRYLGSEVDGIETKAVASVPANVANLSTFSQELRMHDLIESLKEIFIEMYHEDGGVTFWTDEHVPAKELAENLDKNSSTIWMFEQTPPFEVELEGAHLEVKKGRVMNRAGNLLFSEWLMDSRSHERSL